MFKVITTPPVVSFYIQNSNVWKEFLHSDGSVHRTVEYWPTRELAQAVLDKYQPQHIWKHGDVFENHTGNIHIYLEPHSGPIAVNLLNSGRGMGRTPGMQMRPAAEPTFLFNIKDALDDRGIPCQE